MNKQIKGRCIKCGSYAFNLYKEGVDQGGLCDVHYWQDRAHKAEAQPEQEPVGEFKQSPHVNYPILVWNNGYVAKFGDKLYTTPPKRPWVGLTDEQREECTQSPFTEDNYQDIEDKLKELNT